jgi:hypothetical protein
MPKKLGAEYRGCRGANYLSISDTVGRTYDKARERAIILNMSERKVTPGTGFNVQVFFSPLSGEVGGFGDCELFCITAGVVEPPLFH